MKKVLDEIEKSLSGNSDHLHNLKDSHRLYYINDHRNPFSGGHEEYEESISKYAESLVKLCNLFDINITKRSIADSIVFDRKETHSCVGYEMGDVSETNTWLTLNKEKTFMNLRKKIVK